MSTTLPPGEAEWLEVDGLGEFASGTVSGIRTRRYHGLLVPATIPPAGRTVLVNGFEAWVDLPDATFAISAQRYSPDVLYPDGAKYLTLFRLEPWPAWTFELGQGIAIEQEFFAVHGSQTVALSWKLTGERSTSAKLRVRLLLSGRDFHSTHHENNAFQFEPLETAEKVIWRPYPDLPSIEARSNATYRHDPCWYRNFLYIEEQRRGLDCTEDLASPGVFEWEIRADPAVLLLSAQPTNANQSDGTSTFTTPCDTRKDRGDIGFLHRSGLPLMRILSSVVKDERLSQVIPGLATGAVTRSLLCAVFA
jgi:predicted glycogen debranching enzyme